MTLIFTFVFHGYGAFACLFLSLEVRMGGIIDSLAVKISFCS